MSIRIACSNLTFARNYYARQIRGRVPVSQHQHQARRRRLLSSELQAVEEEAALAAEESLPLVARHGHGDGIVTLNVGGKEFITLRSTIQLNTTLQTRVTAAEANQEFTKGAIFIDRDPTYFHLILQHLRNRADRMHNTSHNHSGKKCMPKGVLSAKKKIFGKSDVLIQIPKDDKNAVRDLYVEARYFQIYELESLLCSIDWYTRVADWFGGGSANPFYAASQAITTARRALVASSGFGIVLGSQNEDLMNNMKGSLRDTMKTIRGQPTDDSKDKQQGEKKAELSFT